jgi:hypothetical protein
MAGDIMQEPIDIAIVELGRVCKVYSAPNHKIVAAISHIAW